MSKSFEVLQQAEMEQQLRAASKSAERSSSNGAHNRLELEDRTKGEAIKLAQSIFLTPNGGAWQAVVFASVDHGDGCSTVCACAAEALVTQSGKSVCVVDANFRTPALHNFFNLENRHGLTDSVMQPGAVRNFAQQVGGSNLWVMTCGSIATDAWVLLNDERLRERIAELRHEFEYVLIDAPPVNRYVDAITLGRLTHGVILVLQAAATRPQAAWKAKKSLTAANVRVLGAVLNKRKYPIPETIYNKL